MLVLEDFADFRAGDNEQGATEAEVQSILRVMADIHWSWWASGELDQYPFLRTLADFIEQIDSALSDSLPVFLERFGQHLSHEDLGFLYRLPDRFRHAVSPLTSAPLTLVHGDLSLKNTLIGGSEEDPEIVLIDWQMASSAPAARDLSYFLGESLWAGSASMSEFGLLAYYHGLLLERGIAGYPYERLINDYRRSVICDLARLVCFGGLRDPLPGTIALAENSIRGRAGAVAGLDLQALLQ